jgi:hypothetical protein
MPLNFLTFEEIIRLHETVLEDHENGGFDENLVKSIMGTVEAGAFWHQVSFNYH